MWYHSNLKRSETRARKSTQDNVLFAFPKFKVQTSEAKIQISTFYILHRPSRYRLHSNSSKSLFLPKVGQFDAAYNSQQAKGWSDHQFALIFFPPFLRKPSIPVIRGPGRRGFQGLTLAQVTRDTGSGQISAEPMLGQLSTRGRVMSVRSVRPQLYLGTPGGNMCHPRALTRPSSAHQVTVGTKWA